MMKFYYVAEGACMQQQYGCIIDSLTQSFQVKSARQSLYFSISWKKTLVVSSDFA